MFSIGGDPRLLGEILFSMRKLITMAVGLASGAVFRMSSLDE